MIDPEILSFRHQLHVNPDLSNVEQGTASIIKNFIAQFHPTSIIENIGGAGLAAVYEFPKKGKTIAIRCELDALPILESNPFEHKSTKESVSHKCGHDGHMAIVASLAKWLHESAFEAGKVVLLFQPAEEIGEGAERIVNDPRFKVLQTDYVFALHNIPKEPMHSIILIESGFSAEVISFELKLMGKKSHASEPEHGINPALCISELVGEMNKLNVSDPKKPDFAVLTPVHMLVGQKAYGISAGSGELHYTLRCWNPEKMQTLKSTISNLIKQKSKQHRLDFELNWLEYFPASSNDFECNAYIQKAALENDFYIIERDHPFKFGEDFGWFSKTYKTAMFGLGAGLETPALHNPDYDFPDELIPTGFSMFTSIIQNILLGPTKVDMGD
ncbi:amidohydrolase [Flagellimonas zhangzhouensis]|uniref:Amidohydrolase n=1 Tax=Flagellimonas zhangzhouensis TaxID=1073328 RepID=A0A1H2VYR6_9FLAO|nr:amidohydrolase [Allomuricauda zhangzhouensis]SDQ04953.1 amidohydrolase [Allomuricauda zhangzhouensis]SDW73144.1 amidohydrolase [Allomuricauda zhangzhouensis]